MLQLKTYFFTNVNIDANPDFDGQDIDLSGLDIKFLPSAVDQDDDISVNLNIILPIGPNVPYSIHLHAFGIFGFDSEEDKTIRAAKGSLNGVNLLYTASREFILSLTSRGPFGPLQLPTKIFGSKDILKLEDTKPTKIEGSKTPRKKSTRSKEPTK